MRLGVFNFKGGVGKTFIASHILFRMSEKNKVLGIDTDPQGDLMKWVSGYKWKKEKVFSVNGIDLIWAKHPDFEDKSIEIPVGYNLIVFDGRPDLESIVDIVPSIDVIIVPVKGRLSYESSIELKEVLEAISSNAKCFVVKNEILPMKVIASREEMAFLSSMKIEVCEHGIYRSVKVREAEQKGCPVWDLYYQKNVGIRANIDAILNSIFRKKGKER